MTNDLDLGLGHMAHHRIALIDFYLHTKLRSNRKNFLWTDTRTDVRANGWTDIETGFITGCAVASASPVLTATHHSYGSLA